jgi:hypothetical protein
MPRTSLPSFLFLSPTSSSRLVAMLFAQIHLFSTGILFSTRLLSPHLSTVNSIFSRIEYVVVGVGSNINKVFHAISPFCVHVRSLHC